MQIGKAARSNGSHIKSRLKMEPHGVFKEVTKQCTNKDHYQSINYQFTLCSYFLPFGAFQESWKVSPRVTV